MLPPLASASNFDPVDSTELKRFVPGVEAVEAVEADPTDLRWILGVCLRNNALTDMRHWRSLEMSDYSTTKSSLLWAG